MSDDLGSGEVKSIPVRWQLESGPAPAVNQYVLQTVVDADQGPGEIVVTLGYVLPPLVPPGADIDEITAIDVSTVARFSLSRNRAAELAGYLSKQVADWDNGDEIVRKGDQ